MTVAPVIEECAGCGPGARLAARFMRRVVRPLVERLPWTPFSLRFVPLIDLGAALLLPPRGTRAAAVKGLGCGAEWVRGPGVPTGSRRWSSTSTAAASSPAGCAPTAG